MEWIWALLLVLAAVVGWALNLIGLPGNWVIVAGAAIYALLLPSDHRTALGWYSVVALAVLALIGELLEFAASAATTQQAGGSRRSALLAIVGAVIGGIVGMFVGLPIPAVGSLLGGVLMAAAGALIGAMLGETGEGRGLAQSWQVGKAAFKGRLLGTFAKLTVATVMVCYVLAAVFL